jgi:Beta-ketoacyl synthase, N-terminal domain
MPGTPELDVSYDSIQSLAADVELALSRLRMRMDAKFDTIATLLEKRTLLPQLASPESVGDLSPEKLKYLPPPQEPWLEKGRASSTAVDTFPPKGPRREFAAKLEESDKLMPIAIVGMGCRFPQDATSPERLYDMILRKQSARSDIPSDRFNVDAFYHPDSDRNGMVSNKTKLEAIINLINVAR